MVLYVVSHLVISLAVIVVYAFLKVNGHDVATLENLLLVMGGYWFGAIGKEVAVKKVKKLDA